MAVTIGSGDFRYEVIEGLLSRVWYIVYFSRVLDHVPAVERVFEAGNGVFNFPVWPARIVVAAGLILLTIQLAITLAKLLGERIGRRVEIPQEELPPSLGL